MDPAIQLLMQQYGISAQEAQRLHNASLERRYPPSAGGTGGNQLDMGPVSVRSAPQLPREGANIDLNKYMPAPTPSLDGMVPLGPEPKPPVAGASGEAMRAYQDYADQQTAGIDRGGGFDPTNVERFSGPQGAAAQPTAQPDFNSGVQMYAQKLVKEHGPEKGQVLFKQQMVNQRAQLQQQLNAVNAALGVK